MAPHDRIVDSIKDLMKMDRSCGDKLSSPSLSLNDSFVETDLPFKSATSDADADAGADADADADADVVALSSSFSSSLTAAKLDEREKARRLLAMCDELTKERGFSTSCRRLSSAYTTSASSSTSSLSPSSCASADGTILLPESGSSRPPSAGRNNIRQLSLRGGGSLIRTVLIPSDGGIPAILSNSNRPYSPPPPTQRCTRCPEVEEELASLRAQVEGMRVDLRRMAERRNDDEERIMQLRKDNDALRKKVRAVENERDRMGSEAEEAAAREGWLERENERLRRRLEAGTNNLSDEVVELSDIGSILRRGAQKVIGSGCNDEIGVDDEDDDGDDETEEEVVKDDSTSRRLGWGGGVAGYFERTLRRKTLTPTRDGFDE